MFINLHNYFLTYLADNGYVLPKYPVSHWVGLLDSEPFGSHTLNLIFIINKSTATDNMF